MKRSYFRENNVGEDFNQANVGGSGMACGSYVTNVVLVLGINQLINSVSVAWKPIALRYA